MGLGLISTVALTNHSCHPNVEVDYEGSCQAIVRAVRPIAEGDEVTQSYINEMEPLGTRQRALRDRYGFVCACLRCRAQAAEAVLRRRLPRAIRDEVAVAAPSSAEVATLIGVDSSEVA